MNRHWKVNTFLLLDSVPTPRVPYLTIDEIFLRISQCVERAIERAMKVHAGLRKDSRAGSTRRNQPGLKREEVSFVPDGVIKCISMYIPWF